MFVIVVENLLNILIFQNEKRCGRNKKMKPWKEKKEVHQIKLDSPPACNQLSLSAT